MKHNNLKLRVLFLLLGLMSACVLAVRSPDKAPKLRPASSSVASPVIRQICSKIYDGDFSGARELFGGSTQPKSTAISQLIQIVSEYEAIQQRRQAGRKTSYEEQLAELEKLQIAAEANEVNDVNSVSNVTSVLLKACEFANDQQKRELLSEPFVKQTIDKAVDKSAEFESEGKWLEAYLTSYSWLQTIDKDNKHYPDYAEQLLDKANIVASFQDSPCESRQQRFQGVRKELFVKAVDILHTGYVTRINDYREMVTSAVKRCKILADVMGHIPESDIGDANMPEPTPEQLRQWSQGLDAVLDELENSQTEITRKKFIDIFYMVLELNELTVKLPKQLLIAQFAESSLSALDPYTVMVWPRQVMDFDKLMTNEFTGIGIVIGKVKGRLSVSSLLPDTPAYKSGLDAGDVIAAVDGVDTKDMSTACAVKNITGPAGTKVRLTIQRPGQDEKFDITITRAKIIVPTIRGWQRTEAGKWLYMIDQTNKIGYARLTSFSENTAADLEDVLDGLEAEGLKGFILDLRFNTGGLLPSAIDITDKFIEAGTIVSTRPRIGVWDYHRARKRRTHPNYPLVVLINRFSASASEIVAGALADTKYNRAVLVGERTHGKGSVQSISQYPGDGAQLKFTMAYYHLPSGQRVENKEEMKKQGRQDWGVAPNVEVMTGTGTVISDEERETGRIQRDNDVLFKADHSKANGPPKRHTIEETLAADPQLAVGVLVVKTKLIEQGKLID